MISVFAREQSELSFLNCFYSNVIVGTVHLGLTVPSVSLNKITQRQLGPESTNNYNCGNQICITPPPLQKAHVLKVWSPVYGASD